MTEKYIKTDQSGEEMLSSLNATINSPTLQFFRFQTGEMITLYSMCIKTLMF